MATTRLTPIRHGLERDDYTMVSTLFGLPMTLAEALSYSDLQAGCATERQRSLLKAWLVKMTLLHGTWVSDLIRFD